MSPKVEGGSATIDCVTKPSTIPKAFTNHRAGGTTSHSTLSDYLTQPSPICSRIISHIPFDLPGGLSKEQCDTILSLVAVAENSTTKWHKKYDYCEDIGDGRGLTVSIVGFCSGTSDLLWVVTRLSQIKPDHPLVKYIPALREVDGTDSTKPLKHFAKDLKKHCDDAWKCAVWEGIIYHYWKPAMDFAEQIGCHYPITKGFLYDLALNHGADQMAAMAARIAVPPPCRDGNEKEWLAHLIWVRRYIIMNEDPSTNDGQTDRCDMWNSVLDTGNVGLQRPLRNLWCYGDKFSIE
ncbi:hypothetical protein HDV00_006461 [Rhizophlyctis rosea]|nr:hypothetical protein HDV00_006461 [Rhizophlyctis rosea]